MNVDGVNAKINRAEKHLHELRGLTDPIVAVATASIVREAGGDSTKLLYRATEVPALPAEIGTIVGDILCNLRSALDHLAWQLVEREGLKPTRATFFPIYTTRPVDKRGASVPVTIRPGLVDPALLQLLREVQPFERAAKYNRDPKDEALALLQTLNNLDKHNLLIASVCTINREMPGWWGKPDASPDPGFTFRVSPIVSGDVVARFDFKGQEPWNDFEPNLSLATSIWDPAAQWLSHIDIAEGLSALCGNIRWMISYEFLRLVGLPPLETTTQR